MISISSPIQLVHNALNGKGPDSKGYYQASCPVESQHKHGDKNPSFSYREMEDGGVYLHCFSGCSRESILASLQLHERDMHSNNGYKPTPRHNQPPITVIELAINKQIPWQALFNFGVTDGYKYLSENGKRYEGLRISYKFRDGSEHTKIRVRYGTSGHNSLYVKESPGKVIPYGLWKLKEAEQAGYLVIGEGESDAWTCWYHGVPFLGIPGASMTNCLDTIDTAKELALIPRVYILQEPDQAKKAANLDTAAQGFYASVYKRLCSNGYTGEIYHVNYKQLTGYKDPNDMHKALLNDKTCELFKPMMEEALQKADPSNDRQETEQVPGDHQEELEEKETLAEKLRRMALQEATFFRTPGGELYATVNRKGHEETMLIGGRGGPFKRWLMHIYAQETSGKIPNATAVSNAIDSLEAYAENEGESKEVYLRIAHHNDKIYLNLANEARQVVEIDEAGWRIVDTSPVCFRQSAGMLPLPIPAQGGNLKDLPRFINLHSDNDDSLLVLAWVIGFFLPNGAYPILNVHGERGAAKSTASRFLRGLVDPHQAALRRAPDDARSLAIMGHNNAIVTLDNLSHISGDLSDGLCCLSTGAGDAYRTLYTDNEETIFALKRPIILNGIEEVVTRGDLLDRSITINLPEIEESQRKPERVYWQEVEQAHPQLLGAILDAVSNALRNLSSTKLDQLPRMADFALWVTACELCLSDRRGRFMEAYQSNRKNSISVELEASPLATAIEKLMEETDIWEGMTTDLLSRLKNLASDEDSKSKAWPINARSLSGKLKRLATSFRSQGIDIHQGRDKKGSTVTLQKISSAGVANSPAGVANSPAGVANKIICYTHEGDFFERNLENGVDGVANDANYSFPTIPKFKEEKREKDEVKVREVREEEKYQKFATLATLATPRQPLREF